MAALCEAVCGTLECLNRQVVKKKKRICFSCQYLQIISYFALGNAKHNKARCYSSAAYTVRIDIQQGVWPLRRDVTPTVAMENGYGCYGITHKRYNGAELCLPTSVAECVWMMLVRAMVFGVIFEDI